MGWRDRVERGTAKLGEQAREAVAGSERVQRAGEGLQGFRHLVTDDERRSSLEAYLLALVDAVREDERDEDRSRREVYVQARKRRRRLGLISFGAGPLAGVASRVADLYCEVATVCDVADLHDLRLSDEQIAAQVLELWSVVDDLGQAEGAVRGEPPIAQILAGRLGERFDLQPDTDLSEMSSIEMAKLFWEVRGMEGELRDSLTGAKDAAGGQPIRSVAFTGYRVKKVIKRVETQLGVRS